MTKKSEPEGTTNLVIEFPNSEARHAFAIWLCEQGEQDYWIWQEEAERRLKGPAPSVLRFEYHGPDPKKPTKFLKDGVIRTVCGRLSDR